MNSLRTTAFWTSILLVFPIITEAQYQVNGSASNTSCNCYELTPAQNSQAGSVWNVNTISLNDPFDFTFDIFLGCSGGGADGMVFGLQPVGTGIGTLGGGMGFQGVTPSLGTFIDTYQNGSANDPWQDHVSLNANGMIDHNGSADDLSGAQVLPEMEDCAWHTMQVTWDPITMNYTVTIDGVQYINYTGDIINNIFGGNPNVFWGFTAATGGLNNQHQFCTQLEASVTPSASSACPGEPINFVDNSASFGQIIDWSWDYGDGNNGNGQNTTHTYSANGTYNVQLTITDASGCTDDYTFPVSVASAVIDATATPASICAGESSQLSTTVTPPPPPDCIFTLNMFDSYGDGWNGASIDVLQDGTNIGNLTFTSGSSGTGTFSATHGTTITLVFNGGTYDSECSFDLLDDSGTNIGSAAQGTMTAGSTVLTFTVDCGFTTPTYDYTWTPTASLDDATSDAPLATPGSTQTYTVTITDPQTGCTATDDVTVTIGGANVDDIADQTVCDLYTLPTITGSTLSGNESYYTGTNATGTALSAGDVITTPGTQTIYIFDTDGICTDEESFTVTINESVDAGQDNNAALCNAPGSDLDISTLLSASAQTGGTWNETTASGQFTGTMFAASGLTAGTYSFTYIIAATAPCVDDTAFFDVTVSPAIDAGGDSTISICSTDGAFPISNLLASSASGGGTWSEVTSSGAFNSASADFDPNGLDGTFTFNYDLAASGTCPADQSVFTVNVEIAPTAQPGISDTSCNGLTYALNATASSGTGNWTSALSGTFSSNSDPNATFTAPNAGTYTLVWAETTPLGCSSSDSIEITVSDLSFVDQVTQSSCGNADGAITITASSGMGAYQYSNDNGASFQNGFAFNNLLAGTYNIIVSDDAGCTSTGPVTITDAGGPTIDQVNVVDVSCSGLCDGSITVSATGATQFSINNGAMGPSNVFSNLCAGTYTIIAEAANGCQFTITDSVLENLPVQISESHVDLICANQCDGAITSTATGGNGTFLFSLDGAAATTNGTFNNLCDGTYQVIVEDGAGCSDSVDITITTPTPLTMTIGVQNVTCSGMCDGSINCIPSGGTGNYTYNWSNTGSSLPINQNLCAGTFNLTVTDDNGCSLDSNNIAVIEPQTVIIDNILEQDEACFGDCTGELQVQATGAVEYSLTSAGPFQASPTFSNLCAGQYTVFAQDTGGCFTSTVANIGSPSEIVLTTISDTTICTGGTADLAAIAAGGAGNYTYAWDNGDTAPIISVSPTSDQVYCAVATDANGCQSNQSCVIVSLNPDLQISAFTDATICEGSQANLSAFATGGDGDPYTYTWDQSIGVGADQTVSPTATTTYTVTVTDGCETPSANASVVITVIPQMQISFTADTLEGCNPVTVQFTEVNVPQNSTCLWTFGDGNVDQNCTGVSHTYTDEGCWDVTLMITDTNGCTANFTQTDYICVHGYSTASFDYSPQSTTITNPEIQFNNTSTGAVIYIWDFMSGTSSDNSVDPTFTFPNNEPGSYEVCLTAINEYNCPSDTCDSITIKDEFIIYVPNAFSPDNDGINETFGPVINGHVESSYEFMVFNRWGELIFESTTSTEQWDGTHNGAIVPSDAYVWRVLARSESSNELKEYIGHVTVLR